MKRSLFALALLCSTALQANNIQVSTGSLLNFDGINGIVDVQFSVSWENSWRTSTTVPFNWDAAWVFVKYRDSSTGLWQHCRLGSDAQHFAPAGATLTTGLLTPGTAYNATTNYGVGASIHRSADGTGTFTANDVRLRWNYATNGVIITNVAEVRVYAVEMVYVPQGSFWLGDGGTSTSRWFAAGTTNSPFQVTSEAAIPMNGGLPGNLVYVGQPVGSNMPAGYPKGFNAHYVMKYEISQQGYVDFLNTLTYTQQTTRTAVTPNSAAGTGALSSTNANRNGIDIQTPGVSAATPAVYACNLNGNTTYGEPTDGQWLACSWMGGNDVLAYLDWSGLRPMTDLEYEKSCRGPATPVANEYAWGTTVLTQVASLTNAGAANEGSGTAGANAVASYAAGTPGGPVRVGAFATGLSSRELSGVGYYGAMELSGNVHECVVGFIAGSGSGASFTGAHGDGALDASGNANIANTPIWIGGSQNSCMGARGTFNANAAPGLRVSDRSLALTEVNPRADRIGGRGVRTAP